jgi:hypothetical protein
VTRFIALSLLFVAACSPATPACRVGADCASGVCNGDGTCGSSSNDDSGTTGGGSSSGGGSANTGGGSGGGTSTGGGSTSTGGGTADAGATCLPNHDGIITRAEVPLAAGLHATYRIATDATFSTTPTPVDGGLGWDLTGALANDQDVLTNTTALTGTWFAASYSDSTYTTQLTQGSNLLGVFKVQDDGLYLMGVVTPTNTYPSTNLSYSPPAKLLAFPLMAGGHWTTTSTVSGTYEGSLWTQTEEYDSTVDDRGTALTPFSSFDVLRVKTVLTRTVGIVPTITRSDQLVTECFGTVATLTSQSDETGAEFSNDAEVRRLAP